MIFTLKILRWVIRLFVRIITFPFRLLRRLAGSDADFGNMGSGDISDLWDPDDPADYAGQTILGVAAMYALVAVTGALRLDFFTFLSKVLPVTPMVLFLDSAALQLFHQGTLGGATAPSAIQSILTGYVAFFGAVLYGAAGYGLKRRNWYAGVAAIFLGIFGILGPFLTSTDFVSALLGAMVTYYSARAVRELSPHEITPPNPGAWSSSRRLTVAYSVFAFGAIAAVFLAEMGLTIPDGLWFVPATPFQLVWDGLFARYVHIALLVGIAYGLARRSQGAWVAGAGVGAFGVLAPLLDVGASWVSAVAALVVVAFAVESRPGSGSFEAVAPTATTATTSESTAETTNPAATAVSADLEAARDAESGSDGSGGSSTAASVDTAERGADSSDLSEPETAVEPEREATTELDADDEPITGETSPDEPQSPEDSEAVEVDDRSPASDATTIDVPATAVSAAADTAVVVGDAGAVAFDGEEERWQSAGTYVDAAASTGRVFLATADGTVRAVDDAGDDAWVFPYEFSDALAAGPVAVTDGVVAASQSGQVAAIDAERGNLTWECYLDDVPRSLAADGDTVYAAIPGGVAVVTPDGVQETIDLDGVTSVATTPNGLAVLTDDALVVFRDGTRAWEAEVSHGAGVGTAADHVAVATEDGQVREFTADGETAWTLDVDGAVRDISTDGDAVFVATDAGTERLDRAALSD